MVLVRVRRSFGLLRLGGTCSAIESCFLGVLSTCPRSTPCFRRRADFSPLGRNEFRPTEMFVDWCSVGHRHSVATLVPNGFSEVKHPSTKDVVFRSAKERPFAEQKVRKIAVLFWTGATCKAKSSYTIRGNSAVRGSPDPARIAGDGPETGRAGRPVGQRFRRGRETRAELGSSTNHVKAFRELTVG